MKIKEVSVTVKFLVEVPESTTEKEIDYLDLRFPIDDIIVLSATNEEMTRHKEIVGARVVDYETTGIDE